MPDEELKQTIKLEADVSPAETAYDKFHKNMDKALRASFDLASRLPKIDKERLETLDRVSKVVDRITRTIIRQKQIPEENLTVLNRILNNTADVNELLQQRDVTIRELQSKVENLNKQLENRRKIEKKISKETEESINLSEREKEIAKEIERIHEDLKKRQISLVEIRKKGKEAYEEALKVALKQGKSEEEAKQIAKARSKEVVEGLKKEKGESKVLGKILSEITDLLGRFAIPVAALASFTGAVALLVDAEGKARQLRGTLMDISGIIGKLNLAFDVTGGASQDLSKTIDTLVRLGDEYNLTLDEVTSTLKNMAEIGVDVSKDFTGAIKESGEMAILLGRDIQSAASFLAEGVEELGIQSKTLVDTFADLYDEMIMSGMGASRFSSLIMNSAQSLAFLGGQMKETANLIALLGEGAGWSSKMTERAFEDLRSAGENLSDNLIYIALQSESTRKILADFISDQIRKSTQLGKLWREIFQTADVERIRKSLERLTPFDLKAIISELPGEQKLFTVLGAIQDNLLGIRDITKISGVQRELLKSLLNFSDKQLTQFQIIYKRLEDRLHGIATPLEFLTATGEKQKEYLERVRKQIGETAAQNLEQLRKNLDEMFKTRTRQESLFERVQKWIERKSLQLGNHLLEIESWLEKMTNLMSWKWFGKVISPRGLGIIEFIEETKKARESSERVKKLQESQLYFLKKQVKDLGGLGESIRVYAEQGETTSKKLYRYQKEISRWISDYIKLLKKQGIKPKDLESLAETIRREGGTRADYLEALIKLSNKEIKQTEELGRKEAYITINIQGRLEPEQRIKLETSLTRAIQRGFETQAVRKEVYNIQTASTFKGR